MRFTFEHRTSVVGRCRFTMTITIIHSEHVTLGINTKCTICTAIITVQFERYIKSLELTTRRHDDLPFACCKNKILRVRQRRPGEVGIGQTRYCSRKHLCAVKQVRVVLPVARYVPCRCVRARTDNGQVL